MVEEPAAPLLVLTLTDLSPELGLISGLDGPYPLTPGRGDKARHGGSGLTGREPKPATIKQRDIYEPDLHIDTLRVKARNFR